MPNYDYVSTIVAGKHQLTDRIVSFELTDLDCWKLPPFQAGAHIDVHLPSGAVRQYSLCSDPAVSHRYQIAVLRSENGRGGSKEIVDNLNVGDELPVSLPRNLFPLDISGRHSVLIAGGIGITPMMSMIPVLLRNERPFELHFCTRDMRSTPFLQEISDLTKSGRGFLYHDDGESSRGLNFDKLIERGSIDTHYYCCGPSSFLDAFLVATKHLPQQQIHFERFSANLDPFQPAFALRLQKSGRTFEVGKGESVAAALQRNGIKIMIGCGAGICGLCRVPVLAGEVVHRDFKLTTDDRKSYMTSCVSGCMSDVLVLDL